ncbi:uncharacterized protein LOC118319863 isoform X2 [Scophthalmus maximus]|uniref:uncharacterized protein LOC118319863 isoform X2 n=1 Tax=Scophthalmus maximus TaxID=52904 RepID=UPI001FA8BB92|nr:uncharacterized protein LOC118319863 isoform X2 [Scophthalmus maximus]
MFSSPHVSLCKAKDDQWSDTGAFVAFRHTITDWEPTSTAKVMYSPLHCIYMEPFKLSTLTLRDVCLIDENDAPTLSNCLLDVSTLPTALQEVPSSLWATHKYDVGHIRNAEPAGVIVPLTDSLQSNRGGRKSLMTAAGAHPAVTGVLVSAKTSLPVIGALVREIPDSETLRSGPLPSHYSAQAAELTALTKACKFSAGNARADAAAKAAARPPPPPQLPDKPLISVALLQTHVSLPDSLPSTLSQLQSLSTPEENHLWSSSGCTFSDAVWWGPNGHPCLPKHFFPHFAKLTHGLDHVSKGGMLSMVDQYWFTKSFSIFAQKHCQACVTCATHNVGRPVQVSAQAAHPPPTRPFEHMMMDFIELDPSEGKKHCLVMVDMWSKRVEAFPASKQTAGVVAKALLTEIIPRWGIPSRLSTDNGTHLDTQGFVVSDAPYSL